MRNVAGGGNRGVRMFLSLSLLAGLAGTDPLAVPKALAEEPVLNIYNWSDYIAPGTVPDFEKATGIKVHYDTYDANETLDAKLKAGHSGYDLVVPSLTPFLAKQIKAGIYQPLDRAKLPNYGHLDESLLKQMAVYDPANAHAIPWMAGTDGIGYNVDKIKAALPNAPVDSLSLIFDPAIVAKFKDCGVSLLDAPTDVFPAVLHYLGLNPNSQDPADLKKAAEALERIRPYIRKFNSSEYINDLAAGDLCLVWGYSSDINLAARRAAEAGHGVEIRYVIPKEGTQRWIDTMAVPKDAPHPEAAHKFLNYIMNPAVIAATSNELHIESGNADAKGLVRSEIAGDPNVFPPPAVEAKLFTIAVSSAALDRERTRLWTRIKTGS